ncbi:hypothetical protein ACN47E_009863 [Coniothyrium glycines]
MMLYADQPTPPFNSPYQQHGSRTDSLYGSPYPSPIRHERQRKYPEGLGLYDNQGPLPSGLPPSPQPSENWGGHYSSGASPLINEALADPWQSGAFDHPVSRSPLPWTSTQTSPRSSLSSYTREMSSFSHEDSEAAFPVIKLEQPMWNADIQFATEVSTQMGSLSSTRQQPMTVAPERLSNGIYAYGTTYTSPAMPRYEASPVFDYDNGNVERAPSEESVGSFHSRDRSIITIGGITRERTRNRRHTDPAHAAYRCHLCPEKGFARRYNYSQHMLTHDACRRKDNICHCGKEFVRKTDLARHEQSVHERSKPFRCSRCPSAFSRKDTLRRHEEDGCPRRERIPVTDAHALSQLRNDGYTASMGI